MENKVGQNKHEGPVRGTAKEGKRENKSKGMVGGRVRMRRGEVRTKEADK